MKLQEHKVLRLTQMTTFEKNLVLNFSGQKGANVGTEQVLTNAVTYRPIINLIELFRENLVL